MARSFVCPATQCASSGTPIRISASTKNFIDNTIADGLPRHSVSSCIAAAGADIGGAIPAGEGLPQCGQTGASVETSRPQSGQAMTGIGLNCNSSVRRGVGRGYGDESGD